MRISIITLFPEMFSGPFAASIIKRALSKDIISISLVNLRDFATDKYKSVDDHPYGGGVGMILKVDVVDRALQKIRGQKLTTRSRTILLDPQGKPYKQNDARRLTRYDHLILLCGHYEGVDERIRGLVDEELSIGDYVLTGGEIPAMVIVDSVTRLLTGVLKNTDATKNESFTGNLLEYPQYTRPVKYEEKSVPKILLSGNHGQIDAWRKEKSILRTKKRRKDLFTAR